jgi:hypothetical protein
VVVVVAVMVVAFAKEPMGGIIVALLTSGGRIQPVPTQFVVWFHIVEDADIIITNVGKLLQDAVTMRAEDVREQVHRLSTDRMEVFRHHARSVDLATLPLACVYWQMTAIIAASTLTHFSIFLVITTLPRFH